MYSHLRYFWYVVRHKWYVWRGCRYLGVPIWQALIHDWSKFLPDEWFPYVAHFYGQQPASSGTTTGYTRDLKKEPPFELAWCLHQRRNPHHWQFWVLYTDREPSRWRTLPMPERYAREMVADWWGAGMAQGKLDVQGWYDRHREDCLLHPDTRVLVEQLLRDLSAAMTKR